MTLSIPLDASTEAALRRQAAEAGKEISEYARTLIEEAVRVKPTISNSTGETPTLYDRLEPTLKKIWAQKRSTPTVPLHGEEAQIQDLIVEKYRKQGLKL